MLIDFNRMLIEKKYIYIFSNGDGKVSANEPVRR